MPDITRSKTVMSDICLDFQPVAPGCVFQVFLRISIHNHNQVRIAKRVIVDEVVQFGCCAIVSSTASLTPVQSMDIFLPSRSSSSTQPVSMLNLQALSSYFMFVSFPPYGTLTVVCRAFFVIRSRTFFDGGKGFVLFSEEYKKSEPFSYRKKSSDFVDVVHLQGLEPWAH